MKRQAVALVVVVGLLASAGCVGLVLGDGASIEADPAAVDQETLDGTEFRHGSTEIVRINETTSVAGQQREIRATNHVVAYERSIDVQAFDRQAGALVVVSTPDYTVAGRSVNPTADASNRELIERFRDQIEEQLGGLENLREVDERTEPILGGAATVTTFAADAEFEGESIPVNVHVTKVRHEDDVVIGLGVHPEALQQQAPEIFALLRGIEHPADG